jgi:WD40 repeat protein
MTAFLVAVIFGAGPPRSLLAPIDLPMPGRIICDCLALSPDGKRLAVLDTVWDIEARKVVGRWPITHMPGRIAFTPDSKRLLTVDSERWAERDCTGKTVRDLTFRAGFRWWTPPPSTDGKTMAVVGHIGGLLAIARHDAATGKEVSLATIRSFSRDSHQARLGPTGKLFAHPDHQDIDLYDTATGKVVRSLLDHPGRVWGVAFSGDERLLASGGYHLPDGKTPLGAVVLWDAVRGKRLRTITLGRMACRFVALSACGKVVAAAGRVGNEHHADGETRVFDAATGGELARVAWPAGVLYPTTPALGADGALLAVAFSIPDVVRLWKIVRP